MTTFNLIDQPWIPCILPSGEVREFSLGDALARAHEIAEITDESPLVVAALHRLLLAALHRVFGPKDAEDWGELWEGGRFPREALEEYWGAWRHRFDLFGEEAPFYQSAAIEWADEPRAVGVLEFHRSSGDNATLFDHTTNESSLRLSPPQAARALIAHQTFALSGTVGYLKTCEADKDKVGLDAPSARGAVCLLMGRSLFQTLMLNLAGYDAAQSRRDLPAWERGPSQGRGERLPAGRVDLFTWQSRRARLFCESELGSAPTVSAVKLVPGYSVPELWSPFEQESLQVIVLKPDAKPEERPWFQFRVSGERAAWRDASAIFFGVPGKKRRTQAVEWVAHLVEEGKLPPGFRCSVDVMGAATKQQKVELWRRERLPLDAAILTDDGTREIIGSALNYAEAAGAALRSCSRAFAEKILCPQLADQTASTRADRRRVQSLVSSFGAERPYWGGLDLPFQLLLTDLSAHLALGSEEARIAAQDQSSERWREAVRAAVFSVFAGLGTNAGLGVRAQRAHAIADAELRRRIAALNANQNNQDNGGTQ